MLSPKRLFLTNTVILCTVVSLFLIFNLGLAIAQTVTGNITGTVMDSTGAAIAGAEVTARDIVPEYRRRRRPILQVFSASDFYRSATMRLR